MVIHIVHYPCFLDTVLNLFEGIVSKSEAELHFPLLDAIKIHLNNLMSSLGMRCIVRDQLSSNYYNQLNLN